jgi:hypothetical protein
MKQTVYLAGPMAGCDDKQAADWRDNASAMLGKNYRILNPMVRDYRSGWVYGVDDRIIVEGDKNDIQNSDILLVNPWKISVGTSMEVLYAHACGKMIVVVGDLGSMSPWMAYHASRIYTDVKTACDYLNRLATTEVPSQEYVCDRCQKTFSRPANLSVPDCPYCYAGLGSVSQADGHADDADAIKDQGGVA